MGKQDGVARRSRKARELRDTFLSKKARAIGHLHGDKTCGVRVVLRPMVRKARKVVLGDDVAVVRRRRIEAIKDDADEQVHEHVCDSKREAKDKQ